MTRCPRLRAAALAGVLILLAGGLARAQTFLVDDSRSQVLDSQVRMQWESAAPGRGRSNRVVGQATVIVRLDVEPWRGRRGQIFMVLPPRPDAPVEARWTTRGPLQPGLLRSGERALVFVGPMPGGLIEDTMVIRIAADGDSLERDESLEFRFDIEVDQE